MCLKPESHDNFSLKLRVADVCEMPIHELVGMRNLCFDKRLFIGISERVDRFLDKVSKRVVPRSLLIVI